MTIKKFIVGPVETNCYVFTDEATGKSGIVDPGYGEQGLLEYLKGSVKELEVILLTHGHHDHILGIPKVRELFPNAKIYIQEEDASSLQNPMQSLAAFAGYGKQEPLAADVTVTDGDKVAVGETEFTVLHTPGHTKGSVCYLSGDVMFSGDTLFQGTVGRTDLLGGSFIEMMESMKKLRSLSIDYRVLPGHERETTLNREKAENEYMRDRSNDFDY